MTIILADYGQITVSIYGHYGLAVTNSRNGYSKKTIKSELGPIELNIPRDRNREIEPKVI